MTHGNTIQKQTVAELSTTHERCAELYNQVSRADQKLTQEPGSRELALVHTKLEEALMWLEKHNRNVELRIMAACPAVAPGAIEP